MEKLGGNLLTGGLLAYVGRHDGKPPIRSTADMVM
jgi:hypothetical protein